MVVTVLANAVVLLVLWMKRKRSKTTHCFIAALAISDICMSVTVHPMIIATSFGADTNKLFTQKGTKMNTIRVLLRNGILDACSNIISAWKVPWAHANYSFVNQLVKKVRKKASKLWLSIGDQKIIYTGCNFYGFGAVFFGCLDMMIHGTAALSRYLMVIKDQGGEATFTLSWEIN